MATLVFLSWSGDISKRVALALRKWIPRVLPDVEVWMSECDLAAGAKWQDEVNKKLDKSSFGILCVTPENKDKPWLLFEAGALAKFLSSASVCPYLIGLDKQELSAPLAQFQAVRADKDGTAKLAESLNESLDKSLQTPARTLEQKVNRQWRRLSRDLDRATADAKCAAASSVLEIRDDVERARAIASDLEGFLRRADFRERIRYSGFLSGFAIPDRAAGSKRSVDNKDVHAEMLREKKALKELAKRHCPMCCVISPMQWRLRIGNAGNTVQMAERVLVRIQTLIDFLHGPGQSYKNIEWAVSPFPSNNTYIIGHHSHFEGFMQEFKHGYDFTLRQASPEAVNAQISLFDKLFENLRVLTKKAYGPTLLDATLKCLEQTQKEIRSYCAKNG